jgi:soluble lytic murein transglycosylase-like protein
MGFSELILATAKLVGVPGSLLLAICTHESNLVNVAVPHDHGSPSYGLCQIKEDTARSLGFQGVATGALKPTTIYVGAMVPEGKPEGLMVPATNIKYAALYLKMQLDRYDGDWCKSVAAYNSGTYIQSKKDPNKPTNYKYVKKIVLLLDEEHKDFLVCGPREVEDK